MKPSSLKPNTYNLKLSARSGQSLVEVMIALAVLTTGLLGILSLLAQSIYLSKTLSNETVATYLAEEGIEITKNLIDHDVYAHLATPPQGTGWGSCFTGGTDYEVDYTTTNCPPPSFSNTDYLYFNPNNHMYSYNTSNGAMPTGFTRLIRVTPNGANEMTVQSIVSWTSGPLNSENVTLEDHFYNWIP